MKKPRPFVAPLLVNVKWSSSMQQSWTTTMAGAPMEALWPGAVRPV